MYFLFYDIATVVDEDDEGANPYPDHSRHPLWGQQQAVYRRGVSQGACKKKFHPRSVQQLAGQVGVGQDRAGQGRLG